MTELWQRDAVDLARLIRTGRACATEATKSVLARIDAVHHTLNAIVRRRDDEALTAAAQPCRTQLRTPPCPSS